MTKNDAIGILQRIKENYSLSSQDTDDVGSVIGILNDMSLFEVELRGRIDCAEGLAWKFAREHNYDDTQYQLGIAEGLGMAEEMFCRAFEEDSNDEAGSNREA